MNHLIKLLAIVFFINTYGQVGIGTTTPSGALDIDSNNNGLLIPRVSLNATNIPTVITPTTSELVYNTNTSAVGPNQVTPGFYFWDGTNWIRLNPSNNYWSLTGNSGTTAGTNYIGTNDPVDFRIKTNSIDRFNISNISNGQLQSYNSGSSTIPTYSFQTDPDIGMYRIGANILGFATNSVERFRLSATESVFNDLGNNYDFRIESDLESNIFFVDAGANRIGIKTNVPTNMLHMTNGGVTVGGTSMAFFENTSVSGVPLNGTNNNVTSGYNAIEGITYYNGTTYIPAGVFGLAIYNGTNNSPTIGVRGATNEWQGTGVRGSRFNSGGTNTGWGGEFYDDLGYTGFLGTISDERTKKDIVKIDNAISLVNKLNPVTYNYNLSKYPNMGLSDKLEYGFIAEEIRAVLPTITREKKFDTKATVKQEPNKPLENNYELFTTLDYTRFIPILTKAIQEQQTEIEKLKLENRELKEKIDYILSKIN